MIKYISNGDWFNVGTEAILIDDYGNELPFALFEGWKTCDNPKSENRKLGEVYRDQEDCPWDEFEIIEENQ